MKQIFVWCFFGLVFLWNICGSISQRIVTVDNCTCKTSDGGIYSLWPLRRTDGQPRFRIRGNTYPGYFYTYNPCTPVTVGQDDPHALKTMICRDVALCQFAEIEDPREYHQVGLQKGFYCEINQEGQIELAYKTDDPNIDTPYSRVVLLCNESATVPIFEPKDEDNYIFTITSVCACKNRCFVPAPPGPTAPSPTSATSAPSPTSATAIPTTSTTTAPTTHPTTPGSSNTTTSTIYPTISNTTSTTGPSQSGNAMWTYMSVGLGVLALVILIIVLCWWKRHSICSICATDGEQDRLLGNEQAANNVKYNVFHTSNANLSGVRIDNDTVVKKKNCNKTKNPKKNDIA